MLYEIIFLVVIATSAFAIKQADVDYISTNLNVKYDVINNLLNGKSTFVSKITFENTGGSDIKPGSWELFFYSLHLIQPNSYPYKDGFLFSDCKMKVFHINGNLFKLKPENKFRLNTGGSVECIVEASDWQSIRFESMPNWYVAAEGLIPRDIVSTQGEALNFVGPFDTPEKYLRFPGDKFAPFTPEVRYSLNEAMTIPGIEEKQIIPTPVEMSLQTGTANVDSTWVVVGSTKFSNEISLLSNHFGVPVQDAKPGRKYIQITEVNNLNILNNTETHDEAYRIEISKFSIDISVRTTTGAFYAYQTLRSLSNGGNELPVGTIKDQPRFQYRGSMLDVARNFFPKEEVYKLLDAMAMYKLNKFVFYLTEDEGWRLQIPGLPELTDVGAQRCHDLTENECIIPQHGSGSAKDGLGSGFYTVSDYKDILRYANDRHIEIIPEIDMPGNMHAGIKAMEARFRKYMQQGNKVAAEEYLLTDFADTTQYLSTLSTDNSINVCMDSTIAFIRYVIKAIKRMHEGIQPLKEYHFGADEKRGLWKTGPECQAFLQRTGIKDADELKKYFHHVMSNVTDSEGLNVAGWSWGDGTTPYDQKDFPQNRDITVYSWENIWEEGNGDKAYKLANAGYKVVLSHASHLFMEHQYEPDPKERGSSWASRYIDSRRTFGYVPRNIYYNVDKNENGDPVNLEKICPNGNCLQLERPENIIGLLGPVWTEETRTAAQVHEMLFPRLISLAERAWHKAPWEETDNTQERIQQTNMEWSSFAKSMAIKELGRLEKIGIQYRIPLPGARTSMGKLETNTIFPGLVVEYSTDDKQTWRTATTDTSIVGTNNVYLRTRSVDGTRYSRVALLKT